MFLEYSIDYDQSFIVTRDGSAAPVEQYSAGFDGQIIFSVSSVPIVNLSTKPNTTRGAVITFRTGSFTSFVVILVPSYCIVAYLLLLYQLETFSANTSTKLGCEIVVVEYGRIFSC